MAAITMTPYQHVPQIPTSVGDDRLPTVAEVAELDEAAGAIVARLHELLREALTAIRDVVDARLGGRTYQAAEDADRRAAVAGKPITALAKLIATDSERYGRALALAHTVTGRMDHARQAGKADLDRAALAARTETRRRIAEAEQLLPEAWAGRGTGRGITLAEEAGAHVAAAQRLRALADWLDGTDRRLDTSGVKYLSLTPRARGYLIALDSERTGSYPITIPQGVTFPEDYKPRGIYA